MKSITIEGKKWFDQKWGNTYHTSTILIDGELKHKTPMQYGYGDQYVQTALEWLIESGNIKMERHANGSYPPLWQYCQDNGINLHYSAQDVLKREL